MVVGSGGVVALVLGAWSVLWAIRSVPGRPVRSWYPAAAAFGLAMFAFAMLTAQSEAAIGLVAWARADAAERADVVAEALGNTVRPLVAFGIALVATITAAAATARVSPPTEPARPVHALERAALAAAASLAVIDLGVWVALRSALSAGTGGEESLGSVIPRIQVLTVVGAVAAIGTIAIAAGLGGLRILRDPGRAGPAAAPAPG
ncbi:MAG: hypothetical protein ABMB14_34750 [Myxococcota bacterium]